MSTDDGPNQVFFSPGTTPTGWGLCRDGCDLYASTPCCEAMVRWGQDGAVNTCVFCHKVVVVPSGAKEEFYSICLAFNSNDPDFINRWAAIWTGYSESAMTVRVRSA